MPVDFSSLNASIRDLQTQFDSLIAAMKKTSAEFSAITAQLNRPSFLETLSPQRPLSAEKLQRPPPIDTATPAVEKAAAALRYAEKRPPPIDTATPAAEKAAEALVFAGNEPLLNDVNEALALADGVFDYLTEFNPARMQQIVADIEELLEEGFNNTHFSGVADRSLIYFSLLIDNLKPATDNLTAYESADQVGHTIINRYKIIDEYMYSIKEEMETFGSSPPSGLAGMWWVSLSNSVEAALSITRAVLIEPSKTSLKCIYQLMHKIANETEFIPQYKNVHIQAKYALSFLIDCIGYERLTVSAGIYDYIETVRGHIRKMHSYAN